MSADTAAATAAPEHKRATVRPDKAEAVAALAESFRTAAAAVLTEYRGLSVKQITALRVVLGDDTSYAVVKNTLTSRAAVDAGLEGLDALLSGPTAVAFVNGDPVEAAKGLRDFAKANPALVVKGGVMDGKQLSAEEIRKLADLESREVLLAKLAGAMKASLTQAVYLFAAPLAQAARAVGALEAKAQQDPSVLGGGAGTPVADEAPPAEAAPEATAEEAPEASAEEAPEASAEEAPVASADSETSTETSTESDTSTSSDTA